MNAWGAVQTLQANAALLQKAPNASVVLFSTVAVQTGMPYHTSIAMAKGAVEGLTRTLAAEWSPAIRVNCIAPSSRIRPSLRRCCRVMRNAKRLQIVTR